jgi:putative spermidine/putrescine transport system substrate-binding protein
MRSNPGGGDQLDSNGPVPLGTSQRSRRQFLKTAAGAAAVAVGGSLGGGRPVTAQTSGASGRKFEGESLRVQFWAGPEGQAIRSGVVEPFVQKTAAKLVVTEGWTSVSIAKIRAEKANPSTSVYLMDDVGVITTGREGLLEPLELSRLSNVADIYPKFFVEGKGIGFFTYVVAIAYNTNIVKTPPASWSILWDPQFKGKVMLPPVGTTNALLMAIMAAMLNGGSQYNMEPAWEALKALKPNLALMETNQALVAELLRTGEVALVAGRNAYFMKSYIEKGYPIGVALNLKEGTFATPGCAVVVKNHPDKRELADAFINEALSAEAQTRMAQALWFGPTNRKVKLGPEIARYVISTPDQWDATIPLNLDNLAARREEWIQKYTRALL